MKVQSWLPAAVLVCVPLAAQPVPERFDGCPTEAREALRQARSSYSFTGVSVAVSTHGRLTCAGAVGYADSASRRAMTPVTLMRVASVSKVLTAMAIVKLREESKLSLDDKVIDHLRDLVPVNGFADERWRDATLRNLLQHSLGWDRSAGGEPMQRSIDIARELGIRGPATSIDVARWMFGQRLHFAPGSRFSDGEVGYALAGLVVEKVSGMPYEQYVQECILQPLGIHTSMRVGRTLTEGRSVLGENDPDRAEAVYSSPTSAPSVFPYVTGSVRQPYGEWYQEGLEASGGWVANAHALVRLVDGIFGRQATPTMFSAATLAEISAPPSFVNQGAAEWTGLGWQIIRVGTNPVGSNAIHVRAAGLLRGSMAEVYYLANGNTYAFIGNSTGRSAEDDQATLSTLLSTRLGTLPAAEGDLYTQPPYLEVERTLPTIRAQKGVVHGASFEHGVVSGSWMSILGWNLANTTRAWNDSDFDGNRLPVKLDGVEVFINDRPAAVYYVSPTQINIQVPDLGTFSGTATLRTVLNGVSSYPEPIEVRTNAPEFFRYDLGGKSWVSAVFGDGVVAGDPSLAPGLRPARAGDILSIFGSGFTRSVAGQIIGPGEVVAVPNTVVQLGTTNAPVQFSGLTGAGLFQVNVFIPALPPGDYPVSIRVDGTSSLQVGTLAVR